MPNIYRSPSPQAVIEHHIAALAREAGVPVWQYLDRVYGDYQRTRGSIAMLAAEVGVGLAEYQVYVLASHVRMQGRF